MNAADLTTDAVLEAATSLISAFGATDTDAYFGSFTDDATFVFHTERRPVITKTDYQDEWRSWLTSGWSVVAVESSSQRVDLHGRLAVFTHVVRTTSRAPSEAVTDEQTVHERETILFARQLDGSVLAVHEHLSLAPESS